MPITRDYRATEPTKAGHRPDVCGAHRGSRTAETVITLALGTILIALAATMALRG